MFSSGGVLENDARKKRWLEIWHKRQKYRQNEQPLWICGLVYECNTASMTVSFPAVHINK